ncbi:MAG: NAD(P) transhydrogenase subunit alpha [Candidatus Eremiobacteraeota bacterium]|nr:NAD(P) transhydrogenase subunit alpha [Candidatus Eremiobacteraeota bacterium]
MNEKLIVELTIFALSIFVGFEVISKVPSMLHTPLMSATNAVHGIVIVGAMLVAGAAIGGAAGRAIGLAAMILASINVVGGFAVTGRMLQMFRAKSEPRA